MRIRKCVCNYNLILYNSGMFSVNHFTIYMKIGHLKIEKILKTRD